MLEKAFGGSSLVFIIPYYICMAIANHDYLEAKALKQAAKREKKKKPRMKVSGASVKILQKIISSK